MIKTSEAYRQAIKAPNRKIHGRAIFTLRNGEIVTITDDSLMSDGICIEDATSSEDSFALGSVIINKCVVNICDDLQSAISRHDFNGAQLKPQIGLELPNGTTEWLQKGLYYVDSPKATSYGICIEALDNMAKFDRLYKSDLLYPTNLYNVVVDACVQCNVPFRQESFFNDGYVIEKPSGESLTFRLVLSYVAQLAGSYARCNNVGELELKWYDTKASAQIIDGGIFDYYNSMQYKTGIMLDGGTFDYSSGELFDGGLFINMNKYHDITEISSQDIGSLVTVTGVKTTIMVPTDADDADDADEEEERTYIYGEEGYVLNLDGNVLINKNNINELLGIVGKEMIGTQFYPMNIAALSDPSIEAGDLAVVVDRNSSTYSTVITGISFSIGGYESFKCGAETDSENSSTRPTSIDIAKSEIKKSTSVQTDAKILSYGKEINLLTNLMVATLGAFKTEEKDELGGVTYYMHDKPLLKNSVTIWKMGIDGFAVSTDGGLTWNAGFTANGKAVLNLLSVVGISFDWAKGGTMTLGGEGNQSGAMTIKNADGKEIVKLNNGGINLASGASLVSESGVCGNLQYVSNGGSASPLGAMNNGGDISNANLYISVYVPDNYIVKSAKLTMISAPAYWDNFSTGVTVTGYSRGINLKYGAEAGITIVGVQNGGYVQGDTNFEVVTGTKAGGFASKPNGASSGTKQISSGDLASLLTPGKITTFCISATMPTNMNSIWAYTGAGLAILNVIGYTKN